MIGLTFLISLVSAAPATTVPSMRDLSSLMHYSTANYCPSTRNSNRWDCVMYVSPALAVVEPKNNLFGAVGRCQDDYSFGNDYVGSFAQTAYGFDDGTDTGYYMGFNDDQKQIVISFKGTDSLQSAFVDAQFVLQDGTRVSPLFGSGIKMHVGFMKAYNTVRQNVQRQILELVKRRPSYLVTFTGHSLGGALTSIAAVDFVSSPQGSSFKDRVRVITFGAPRVGNKAWASYAQQIVPNQLRVAHQADIVPAVPPKFFGYAHAGQALRLSGNFVNGLDSYRHSACDVNVSENNGESDQCQSILDEQLLMNLFKDLANGGGFDWSLLINAASNTGNALVRGIVAHISDYYSFFTYPPVFPLTNSFYC